VKGVSHGQVLARALRSLILFFRPINTKKNFFRFSFNYIIRDGLSQKTISRYCPLSTMMPNEFSVYSVGNILLGSRQSKLQFSAKFPTFWSQSRPVITIQRLYNRKAKSITIVVTHYTCAFHIKIEGFKGESCPKCHIQSLYRL